MESKSHNPINALLRKDFHAFMTKAFGDYAPGTQFVDADYIQSLTWHLEQVFYGHNKRMIVNMPPRYLKSYCISIAFVAWVLGHHPENKIMCVSYSDELAGDLGRKCRAIMETAWYKEAFPNTRISPKKTADSAFETTRGGGRLGVSMQGSITGRGCDILIIDDPCKADEVKYPSERLRVKDIYENTLFSRLNDKKKGKIILVMQRLHVDDLTAHLQEKNGFLTLSFPAIANDDMDIRVHEYEPKKRKKGMPLHTEREDLATLYEIRATVTPRVFETQYQQNPIPEEGAIFKKEWFANTAPMPSRNQFERVICSWDIANKPGKLNDYSVCAVIGVLKSHYYVMNIIRIKLPYPQLVKKAISVAEFYDATAVLIEDAGTGTAMAADLKQNSKLPAIAVPVKEDKETRAMQVTPMLEAGKLILPLEATWKADFIMELIMFPEARHDDQVDSLTQVLNWLRKQRKERHIPVPPILIELSWDLESQYPIY